MERDLCVVWAGWCRGGDWDARRKRGEGGLAWQSCWDRRMGVLLCLLFFFIVRTFGSGGTSACYSKEEAKVAVVEPVGCLKESNPDCSHISI